jgi:pyridoxamine 5'-phosphate oxidase
VSPADLRREYARHKLMESDLDADPVRQFQRWFDEALAAGLHEPHAMTLATATPDGRPSARMVLLRGVDANGFVFFTNYDSRKGLELTANPRAALLFWWGELERQVRVEGTVEHATSAESDAYFRGRPRESQLGAWTSPQSQVIASREVLETEFRDAETRFPNQDVPRPSNWGGYRVRPDSFEFWQGRPGRLHDRLRYRPSGNGWTLERLAP